MNTNEQMNEKKKSFRNIILIVIVLLALILAVFGYKNKNNSEGINKNDQVEDIDENKNVIELCFADIKPSSIAGSGLEDEYVLRMKLDKDKVTGELNLRPAEKDSKVGQFQGTVSAVDKIAMARTIDAWWETLGEGMQVTEELRVKFGEGTAYVGMGGMKDRGDGTYIYTDKNSIDYSLSLTDVDCRMLDERVAVEEYLKKNIATLAPAPATMGGTWFVLYSSIDTGQNSGYVVYEDGHNQEKRAFSYEPDEKGNIISLKII